MPSQPILNTTVTVFFGTLYIFSANPAVFVNVNIFLFNTCCSVMLLIWVLKVHYFLIGADRIVINVQTLYCSCVF